MERPGPVEDREVFLGIENEDDQPGRDVIIMFAVSLKVDWPFVFIPGVVVGA